MSPFIVLAPSGVLCAPKHPTVPSRPRCFPPCYLSCTRSPVPYDLLRTAYNVPLARQPHPARLREDKSRRNSRISLPTFLYPWISCIALPLCPSILYPALSLPCCPVAADRITPVALDALPHLPPRLPMH
ncbi:hypothetical protein SODALDRAFT_87703 [Sodiomyces alkalinus F11]|uniref:Uncharacterized protein n=1 Tax=Sodiomyces alkalinus (strain CBS 110278 / VKM F-3762 / F11) TaxID=1314773 RepID=A0A3N2PJ11_SODAK|nr:hypothetical protein SODALDRAFT_87703 [Sodiomyces alkalinus F11]ROT34515.1 hypothetical protein SODALDRAFT_87703 [Sodiomyces alkalinus F11]